ncbi:flagellar basal-body MS-ring/collar protein FliF [Vibrio sp. 10N.222.52.C3]|uniref:Flagellar M-ring protein n=1 Tax=Vibrio coralliirubri TaxID=1516159 RepID=A0AA87C0L2_9VIBR|nr:MULTISPECIES: flagellar basal-body MS-ring/collar protein FliF [Vibrio]MCK8070501.1 flagellar M-ring protein FliF [Vibrio sp. 1CM23M]MCK8075195.1 flagellar M-ring protein FliF [Vibrio sp. 1CM2L]MCY9861933.1 flagellar basal-body MS-ring/collar protein FliF [Vibrio coralliirubri]UPR32260.1 flagellar M-ring protein FliF [Vibrio crassostreae]CDT78486.1 Flagellar M-ring protein [Vibrio coralliirubri]
MAAEAETQPALTNNMGVAKEKLTEASSWLTRFWQSSQRNVIIITIFATITAAIIVIMLWTSSERFRPLYSKSANFDSSQVLQMLDEESIRYQLSQDDGQILVPEGDVAKIRMILASKGLKEQLPSGFDSLDSSKSLGESQFMENARYRHALEGELARSITTMSAVSLARVHLAIPKESLFMRDDAEQPRASVIVHIINGMDLKPTQVESIINLVSGAVIGLKSEHVRVVDQHGRLLSNDATVGDITVTTGKQSDYKRNLEKNLVAQATDMLTPILGAANFRVQIASDINFSKVEETEEIYADPVVRKETLLSDMNESSMALGIPGALSNTPPVTDGEPQPEPNAKVNRSETSRDYAVSGKVRHTQHQQGVLQNLSVSIVVNDLANPNQTWTPEELTNVENVVRSAIGFNTERGDSIHITHFPFVIASIPEQAPIAWFENTHIMQPLKYLLGVMLSGLMIMVVLRPLAQYLTKSAEQEELEAESMEYDDVITKEERAADAALQSKLESLGIDATGIKALDDNLPSADSPLEVQIKHLKLIAKEDPNRVAEILRTWIQA